MPILTPEAISTWYYLVDETQANSKIRIVENWEEEQEQEVSPRPMIQGDTGTHVMDVGGIKYITTIDTPILLIESNSSRFGTPIAGPSAEGLSVNQVSNVLELLADSFDFLRNPAAQEAQASDPTNPNSYDPPLMKSGSIRISEENITIHIEYYTGYGKLFTPVYVGDASASSVMGEIPYFISRLAKWYDTELLIQESPFGPLTYPILDATINFQSTIDENYFINTGSQTPFFAVQGYSVSGNLTLLASPNDPYIAIAYQQPGNFSVVGFQDLTLAIGNASINLSAAHMTQSVKRSLSPNKLTTFEMSFTSFARYLTPTTTP